MHHVGSKQPNHSYSTIQMSIIIIIYRGTTVVRIRTHFRGEVGIYMYSASDDNDKMTVKEIEGKLKRVQFQLHSLKSRL